MIHGVKYILRGVLTAALVCMMLPLSGCIGSTAENDRTDEITTAAVSGETIDSVEDEMMTDIKGMLYNGYDKLSESSELARDGADVYNLYMAKNEAEGCQLALRSTKRYGSLALDVTYDDGAPELTIYKESFVSVKDDYLPDALAPFGGKLTLLADRNAVLYLRFTTDNETTAGDYSYSFTLKDKDEVLYSCTVNVHVMDFALPDMLSCATAVGLYKDSIAAKHNVSDPDEIDRLYKAYYDLMLEYKVTAYDLPYDILDEHADAYMSDPRVTSFRVPTCDGDDARLEAIYEKLKSNPVWLDKAYFYPLDEPTSREMLDTLASMCERLNRIAPDVKVCTPFFRNIDYDNNTDQIGFMTGKTTLWCPKSYMYVTSNVYSAAQLEKYPSFGERMAERKAAGDKVWWYVCWEPGDPYNNLFVDQLGVQHRILFWQQYAHDVDGFLYWGANYWNGTSDPWGDMATVKQLSPDVYGDGSLLYNGNIVGADGGCPSLRLAAIRDGVEDFELLAMASELYGDDWVADKIAEITPSLTQYTTDSARFDEVRRSIYEAVEAAMKK